MERAERDYFQERPRFLTDTMMSCIAIEDYEVFNSLSASEQQDVLVEKSAVVIRNWPVDNNLKFDMRGLQTVSACLSVPISIQGDIFLLYSTVILT